MLAPLVEQPGVMKEVSAYAARGFWTDAANVRWRAGYPERRKGCAKLIAEALDTPARGSHAWTALDGTLLVAWGTQDKLWVFAGGILYDITPDGLPSGNADASTFVGGWGHGGWGDDYWGGVLPSAIQAPGARTWSLDNWGEDLVANYFGGGIYHWTYDGSLTPPEDDSLIGTAELAEVIEGAPNTARGIFVSDGDRHLVAIGAHDGTGDNPRNIAWCDQEDLEEWEATELTSAGSQTVSGGDIQLAIKTRLGTLILTSTSAFLMRFIGGDFVFSISNMGDNCGAIGPKAGVDYSGTAYWMGHNEFFVFDGSVRKLDCSLRSFVFDNLNRGEVAKIHAGLVKENAEVWFFYVTEGTEISRYVALNTEGPFWFPGPMVRTTWLDNSVVTDHPIAVDGSGNIFLQETGDTDDGVAIPYFLETNEIEATSSGQQIIAIRKVIPDYQRISGDHTLYLKVRPYPQRSQRTKGPYTFNQNSGKVSVRARGRTFVARFEGDGDFRMGQLRGDIATHGERT